jgi:acetyl esterase/lipase
MRMTSRLAWLFKDGMADRLLVWSSAAALSVGVSAGALAGAALAVADDGATGHTGGTTSSESSTTSKPSNDKAGNDRPGKDRPGPGTPGANTPDTGKTGTNTPDTDKTGTNKPGNDKPGADADPDVRDDEDTSLADFDHEPGVETDGLAGSGKGNDDGPDSGRHEPRSRDQAEAEPVTGQENHAPKVPIVEEEDQSALGTDATPLAKTDRLDEADTLGEAETPTPAITIETPLDRVTDPEPERETPSVVETTSAAVSSTLSTLLHPFSTENTPISPTAQLPMWTLMAAARRDFDTAFESPSLAGPVHAVTTSQVDTLNLSDQSVAPPVFTGQPSLIHQIVVAVAGTLNDLLSPFGGILAFTGLKVPVFADGVPPFFVTYGLDVQRDTIAGMPVYILTPPTPTGATVVALHGGGYAAEASLFHWEMYADLARTTGATVIVPDYPLIGEPGGTASVVVPQTAKLISEVIATHGAENTSVLGDSAGGGLGLAAVQLLVATPGAAIPNRMVLLAPALDLTLSDPASAQIHDPLLNFTTARRLGAEWAGELGPAHPWASPINGSLDGLPPITVYSGSLDLLSPQTIRLRELAIAEGLDITFVLRNGLMHDYPIFGFLPDAHAERPSIYQALLGDPNVAVENSLTYTPPPTIIDQLTLAALRVVRDITGFFGIPFNAILGGLIASENPPFFLTLGLNARQTEFEVSPGNVWKVWEFEPPHPTGATVVAIHGGGNIFQPNLLHWIDYTQMARETGATVLVPLYPLARTEAGSILNVTPGMADYLSHVIDDRGAQNVSVYADSAGYTYAFAAARELILRGDEVPASMVVISGQADYSEENDGAGIDDPFFNTVTIEYFTRFHTFDGVINGDPRISPLRMETEVLQALPPTTIYVGTEEIVLPGNLQLYQRAVDIGAPISMVVGRGQYHDWPLAGLPVNSAAPLVRRDIYRQLGLLPDAAIAAINEVGVSTTGNCNPFTDHCGDGQPAGSL